MTITTSAAFVYAILGGILSVLLYVYYQKKTNKKYEKSKSIYNIGIFCLISNIIYFTIINNEKSYYNENSYFEFDRIWPNPICEMKTGQPNF